MVVPFKIVRPQSKSRWGIPIWDEKQYPIKKGLAAYVAKPFLVVYTIL
ncbi:hypothetical protein GMES_3253 [Paraglaciecola mesophila KMM 241]|jgi:hypothetical protein|uniref:Uncharacterized protein n=1 Tax=Paraglaciecola mesophila KMM 241 TaxID=1128912 RepID=K6XY54_9ALTE|nr:hypothetical protein GMES_3253 [Paraglaciecola mesophila KMM 241]|tara:strand:- start:3544 stop:3687 length:144 start_codon:yes stop_codon:yes gene_type:complete